MLGKRGKLAGVHQIQSLNPATIMHHMALYMAIMYARSPLNRAQREMMVVVVSEANNCAYCQVYHKFQMKGREPLKYDVLMLALDSRSNMFGRPGQKLQR